VTTLTTRQSGWLARSPPIIVISDKRSFLRISIDLPKTPARNCRQGLAAGVRRYE
jgi:hypothetical protein